MGHMPDEFEQGRYQTTVASMPQVDLPDIGT